MVNWEDCIVMTAAQAQKLIPVDKVSWDVLQNKQETSYATMYTGILESLEVKKTALTHSNWTKKCTFLVVHAG